MNEVDIKKELGSFIITNNEQLEYPDYRPMINTLKYHLEIHEKLKRYEDLLNKANRARSDHIRFRYYMEADNIARDLVNNYWILTKDQMNKQSKSD